jgi:Xaa-Pro aminopeptidase
VARDAIRPGVTETEVFGKIFTSLAQSLGGPLTLDCNFGSGPRALGDEPQPTNKPLEAGESVMIDLFPLMDGYVADYTRNFVVGPPTDGQLAQHAILETALAAAEKALRPGVRASEIDRLVRRVIQDAGYGEFAHRHHTGHAFGLTIPEPPWLIPADHTPLRAGMVIAVEPGIYHPENGGMRLEGNYIITEDGCEPLVGFPAKLIVCK